MNMGDLAKICYIHHSGFSVETARHVLIFDYYTSGVGGGQQIPDLLQLGKGKNIVVFASHGHGDHFNKEIFDWAEAGRSITYVLSDDIRAAQSGKGVNMVAPGQSYTVGDLLVRTLESTDLGVAFLVKCDGLTIYHAGDLNWWHWEGEPEEDNRTMAAIYKKQIDLLTDEQIDLAFVPVDPRLADQYLWGLEYLLDKVATQLVFPMHFGEDYGIFARLCKDLAPDKVDRVAPISPAKICFTYPLS